MQVRRLIRARGLASFRAALVDAALSGGPLATRRLAVIVPTRASAELLRQSIEAAASSAGLTAVVLPDLLTREEWLGRLHVALSGAPPRLTRAEREVLLERAAHRAARRPRLGGAPFVLRPGLVAAILDFYDELGRRQRSVRRFGRALFEQLRVERGTDRGSESLIRQTAFLAFSFLGYSRAAAASGALDEHLLRSRLLDEQPALPFDRLVIAVADHPSDPRGLWPADFDLLGRLVHLGHVDVVMTDETHDAGFRDRLEQELPGIEEVRAAAVARSPVLERPPDPAAEPVFVSRDREEEVRDVVRVIRARANSTCLCAPTALVFHRPLPYLYVGQQVFGDGRVPFQAFDALPLGGEPYAALLDLVLAVARTSGTREAVVALLRSSLLRFEIDNEPVSRQDATALDQVLSARRATGEAGSYLAEVDAFFGERTSQGGVNQAAASRGARAAAAIGQELAGFTTAATGSERVRAIVAFLRRHERAPAGSSARHERQQRARAAVLSVLDDLCTAYGRHDDRARDVDELTAAIHHAVEARTFAPRRGEGGVHLVDATAAKFGDFDHVHVLGLVETDWPERARRSLFYTGSLLAALGWPQQADQTQAQQASFRDLLGLARATTRLHAFQLEGDGLVALSPLVDVARDAPSEPVERPAPRAIFADELLTRDWPAPLDLAAEPAAWLALRRRRPPLDLPAYAGLVGPLPPQAYRVSRVDRYVDCPFKYFSETVLQLVEERDDPVGPTPLERGTLLHDLFERFYRDWDAGGRGAITAASLPDALDRFAELTRQTLARLPEVDRALEEARLLGSLVARGVAERVFELEVDAGGDIVRRLLEVDLGGPFRFPRLAGIDQKMVEVRGKADRIDVFRDGSLRVIDYKLARLPDLDRSIQIGVYAHCARQQLETADGRPHPVTAAMYLAFGDDRRLEGRLDEPGPATTRAVEARASAFADTIVRIEAGEFPATPHRPGDCAWCGFAGVCRKEYPAVTHEPAESV